MKKHIRSNHLFDVKTVRTFLKGVRRRSTKVLREVYCLTSIRLN